MLYKLMQYVQAHLKIKLILIYTLVMVVIISGASALTYRYIDAVITQNIESELEKQSSLIYSIIEAATQTAVKNYMRAVAETDVKLLESYNKRISEGELTETQAKERAIEAISKEKIGDSGFVFIVNSQGDAIYHPIFKESNIGAYPFVKQQLELENGYLEYQWTNPENQQNKESALYTLYFEPWDWYISASSDKQEFYQLMSLDDIEDALLNVKFGDNGYPAVLDAKGTFLIHPKLKGRNLIEEGDSQAEIIKELLEKKNGVIEYEWKNPGEINPSKKIMVIKECGISGWIVAASSYKEDFYHPLEVIKAASVGIFSSSILLGILMMIKVSNMIIAPLSELKHKMKQGVKGDLSVRVSVKGKDEIGQLGMFFNHFVENLEQKQSDLERAIKQKESISEELKVLNESLEEKVTERTEELNESLEKLKVVQSELLEDIAERERIESELVIAMEAADEANVAKTEFLSNASHELRTPLNGILGILQAMLKYDAKGLTPDQLENIELVYESGLHLLDLLNEILDLSRAESKDTKIELGPISMDAVLYSKKILFDSLIKNHEEMHNNVEFVIEKGNQMPEEFVSDEAKINQILINLIANAVKFTDKGRIVLRAFSENGMLGFEVEDTGIGIKKEKLELVFDKFTQVHQSSAKKHKGTGLGLSLCKELIEKLKGTIDIQSEYGQGTHVKILIPMSKPTEEIENKQIVLPKGKNDRSQEKGSQTIENERYSILIADDDPIGLKVLRMMLGKYYNLEFAKTGEETLEKFYKLMPDVVLLDIRMPDYSGFEILDKIKESPMSIGVPIIALTAQALEQEREYILSSGFSDYISKPVDIDLLLRKIKMHLED